MIETDRLRLRRWLPRDRAPFAALNADPDVMTYFPKPLTRAESDAVVQRLDDRWATDGIGFGVAERRSDGTFIGMVGLSRIRFGAPGPLEGGLEIGWRLARAAWGQGYATEAATGWLAHGFGVLEATEIHAFAVPANHRSLAVMYRLGMQPAPALTFDHPALPEGHALRRHAVATISAAAWAARA